MITFRQFLDEKAMNSATFADVEKRLGETALVGFEFEICVTQDSPYYVEADDDRETQVISFFDDLSEFEQYFYMSGKKKGEIEDDYARWVETKRGEYIDDNFEKFLLDNDQSEEDAKDAAGDEFDALQRKGRDFDFRDWLKDEFRDNVQFIQQYDLEPRYGWYTEPPSRPASIYIEDRNDEDEDVSDTMKEVADALRSVVDVKSLKVLTDRHSEAKDLNTWYVEPDSSIQGGHGVEIVSPPQPLKKALSDLEDVCKWIRGDNLETNETTGLHINVSVPGIAEKLDRVKLALFLGEAYSAALFDRIGNTYTRPHSPILIGQIKNSGRIPTSFSGMEKMAQNFLTNNKYMSVNFGNLHMGYLEFRFAGNAGYERDVAKIKKAVLRCVTATEIACDPLAEKKEYVKKLVKIFDTAKKQADAMAYAGPDIPLEMNRLAKDQSFKANFLRMLSTKDNFGKRNILINLMDAAMSIAKGYGSEVSIKELAYLKRKAKELGLVPSIVDDYFGTDNENASESMQLRRKEFKKVYRI